MAHFVFKFVRLAVFGVFCLASLAWVASFAFLFVVIWSSFTAAQRAIFLTILLIYGLCLLPFYFMPVFHFPLWVEAALVLLVLLCQVGGTIVLCLIFDPRQHCRNQSCKPVSDVVLFSGCGLTALLLLYLVLLVLLSCFKPPHSQQVELENQPPSQPPNNTGLLDVKMPAAYRPTRLYPDPSPVEDQKYARHPETAVTLPPLLSVASDNLWPSVANKGGQNVTELAKSPRRERFRWSRSRGHRRSDVEDLADDKSIASTTRHLIEFYRFHAELQVAGSSTPRMRTCDDAFGEPGPASLPTTSSTRALPSSKIKFNKSPGARLSMSRIGKAPRLKSQADSFATSQSVYSQGATDLLTNPSSTSPSGVSDSWPAQSPGPPSSIPPMPPLPPHLADTVTASDTSDRLPPENKISRLPESRKWSIMRKANRPEKLSKLERWI